MRDFKFRALAKAPLPEWGWELKDFQSECLRKAADTFTWNLLRTTNFVLMPAYIALEATKEQMWRSEVKALGITDDDAWDAKMRELAEGWDNLSKEKFRELLDKAGIDFVE